LKSQSTNTLAMKKTILTATCTDPQQFYIITVP